MIAVDISTSSYLRKNNTLFWQLKNEEYFQTATLKSQSNVPLG